MARSNSFTLRGFVGKDAELKITSTGKQLAQFSLCVEERWQTVDGPRTHVLDQPSPVLLSY